MKNKHIKLPLLALVMIFIACDNDELKNSNLEETTNAVEQASIQKEYNVTVNNDMLSFETREDYDLTIDKLAQMGDDNFEAWEKEVGFASMRSALSTSQREELGIFDDLLAVLISPDGKIEIAGNVLELDAIKETVTVFSSSNDKDGVSGKNIKIYSTDDNVLDILEGTEVPLDEAGKARYCSKRKWSWDLKVDGVGSHSKVDGKVVYQKAGFLNSLQSKIKETVSGGNQGYWKVSMNTSGSNYWRNKRRTGTIASYSTNFINGFPKSYRPYYASRRLKEYRFSMFFRAQAKTGGQVYTATRTIDCN